MALSGSLPVGRNLPQKLEMILRYSGVLQNQVVLEIRDYLDLNQPIHTIRPLVYHPHICLGR